MNTEQCYKTMDKLFAFDMGCTDSGSADELAREEIKTELKNMPEDKIRVLLSVYIRERFLVEEALKNGYGIEDVNCFIKWLDEYMEFPL